MTSDCFGQTCTFFAVAACLEQDWEVVRVCCDGLENECYRGELCERTMKLLVGGGGMSGFLEVKRSTQLVQMQPQDGVA